MNVLQEDRADLRYVGLDGELTIYAADAVKSALQEALAGDQPLEIDLSNVSAIDTAGIQLLIAAKHHATDHHHVLRLVGHSPAVLELIELYDLSGFFGDPLVLRAEHALRSGEAL